MTGTDPTSHGGAGELSWFSPGPSWGRYILRMWLLAFMPALVLGAVVSLLGYSRAAAPSGSGTRSKAVQDFVGTVVVSPVLETLILAVMVAIFAKAFRSPNAIALASSLLWAAFHSSNWTPWGIIIAWPFFVWTRVYLASKETNGVAFALWLTVGLHALHNFLPAAFLYSLS